MIHTVRHFNTNIKSIFFGNYSMIPYRKVNIKIKTNNFIYTIVKYSLQGTTQGRYLRGGVPPVRFSM